MKKVLALMTLLASSAFCQSFNFVINPAGVVTGWSTGPVSVPPGYSTTSADMPSVTTSTAGLQNEAMIYTYSAGQIVLRDPKDIAAQVAIDAGVRARAQLYTASMLLQAMQTELAATPADAGVQADVAKQTAVLTAIKAAAAAPVK